MSTKSLDTPNYIGHRARLRERFMKEPLAVPDYELLELVLHLVIPRKDTKPIAKDLLEHFGSLRGVVFSRDSELEKVPIYGRKAVYIRTLFRELLSRSLEQDLIEKAYDHEQMVKMVISRFAGLAHEELWIMILNSHNASVQIWKRLATGFDSTVSHPKKEIFSAVLEHGGDAFVLVHNHPGGHPNPSKDDRDFTSKLYWCGKQMEVHMVDHLVVGNGCCYSLLTEKIKGNPPKRI